MQLSELYFGNYMQSLHLVSLVIPMMISGLGEQDQVCRVCVAMFWYSLTDFLWTSLDMKVLNL